MSTIDARLAELGITLPQANAPVASYVPVTMTDVDTKFSVSLNTLATARVGMFRDLFSYFLGIVRQPDRFLDIGAAHLSRSRESRQKPTE